MTFPMSSERQDIENKQILVDNLQYVMITDLPSFPHLAGVSRNLEMMIINAFCESPCITLAIGNSSN